MYWNPRLRSLLVGRVHGLLFARGVVRASDTGVVAPVWELPASCGACRCARCEHGGGERL
eukprot:4666750-Prorocentrum_lima.AAC.1